MSENWMTIEQAAVALGLSVRTVNRHINAGKLQSRLTDGRREVLSGTADSSPGGQSSVNSSPLVIADQPGANSPAIDYETVLALADNAADKAELAVSAYQTLARTADERILATRRLSYVAWALVAMMTLSALAAVGWTSHKLTRAAVETDQLQRQVSSAAALADSADHECDDLRRALIEAREQAARAEGRLAGYSETRQTEPAARPTLTERIASIFE
jgi:excisionase family DNA binding protein